MHNVLLAFGSNLGDRRQTILAAWSEIGAIPDIVAVKLSQLYETQPVGGLANQPDFLNAAGLIQTDIAPLPLLAMLQNVENHHGRVRTEHWGPRTLDIDILLIADQIIATPQLTVPHPNMLYRRFVLEPAAEIAAEMLHPVANLSIGALFSRLLTAEPTCP